VLSVLPPTATAVGVEAQGVSVSLARRSATLNGLSDRFTIVHGDLRYPDVLDANQTFDLITASPPYFPLGTAMPSREVQRALARMELRGSIVDYAKAARRFAAQAARFAYVMPASDPRTEQAAIANGWTLLERTEVIFREGRDPLVVVVVCGLAETCSDSICTTRQLTVRDRNGNWTSDYLALRAYFGFEEQ
jgi:tRNA1(Val) A37 N6-methylase TrmN6